MVTFIERYKIEENEKWREWANKIPYISWPQDWEVKAIPAFAGAMVRYMVKKANGKTVSIYLDVYERLGYFGAPHWEVYPVQDTNKRVSMEDVKGLLDLIEKSEGF